jgi:hypothetical protein
MSQDKKKNLSGVRALLGVAGFILILWGAGIDDDRQKMTPEQAKQELPSQRKTDFMIGAGAVSLLAAAFLKPKNDKESR